VSTTAFEVQSATESSIQCDPQQFSANFNRVPFEVRHSLAGNPLFDVDRIIELAQLVEARRNPHRSFGDAYSNMGEVGPGMKAVEGHRPDMPTSEILRNIENSKAWVTLWHVEREEGYREVLQQCICDLLELSGREVINKIKWFDAILFITSPNRVTHYHVDRECAWLVQLHGDKEIHLFDKRDKEIVPDEELERFWNVDNGAGTYKPQFEDRAMVFRMRPGTGVHIPVNCPHWLKNGSEVSVSMNVNFQFRDEVWGNIFKANYYLRRFGVKPATPGLHPVRDRIKSRAYTAVQQINHLRKGKQAVPPEAHADYLRIRQLLAAR
jgi:hypothetical protein